MTPRTTTGQDEEAGAVARSARAAQIHNCGRGAQERLLLMWAARQVIRIQPDQTLQMLIAVHAFLT